MRIGWRNRIGVVLAVLTLGASTGTASAAPVLVRDTPQVWNVTHQSATIAWFTTDEGADGAVEYGTSDAYGATVAARSRDWPLLESGARWRHHVATLSGLEPGTKYYYRVSAGGTHLTPTEGSAPADFHFVTAPAPGDGKPIQFIVVGDGGEGNKYQRAITHQMERQSFDFVLHTGDVVYDDCTDAEWHLKYYPIYKNLIRNRPWFLSLGNHEYLRAPGYYVVSPEHAVKRQRLFTQQTLQGSALADPNPLRFKPQAAGTAAGYFENAILPEGPGKERYYSFDWGPVHFVVLDSNRSFTPGKPTDPQYQWMVEDLRRSSAAWKVVCFHHPMTSIGKEAYTFSNPSATNLRTDWHPAFEKLGVDVVFVGHDHTYQRTHPVTVDPATGDIRRDDEKGIVHIVTGGGGGGLSGQTVFPAPDWHSGIFHKRHHFLLVKADAQTMQITAIGDADINTPGVTEKQGVGGPTEELDRVTLKNR